MVNMSVSRFYIICHMRKRISKDKDIKNRIEKNIPSPTLNPHFKNIQMLTFELLATKTEGVQTDTKFQKQRIDAIVRGGNIQSMYYQQVQKNICFEQYFHKYYPIQNIRYIFTDLINTNSNKVLTFVDFKRKNFKIMSTYAYQLKLANYTKGKQERTLTTFHSSDKQNLCFKEMEMNVKKMTKNKQKSLKKIVNHNAQASLVQLVASIQKMYKNSKYSTQGSICKQIRINTFENQQDFSSPDVSKIYQSRIHTSPQPISSDSYGLERLKHKNRLKVQNSSAKRKKQQVRVVKQSSKQSIRYQTEYDTQYIQGVKQKVPKRASTKKSFSKNKNLSKSKSPSLTTRNTVKLKK